MLSELGSQYKPQIGYSHDFHGTVMEGPSFQLNAAFTPIITALRRKIEETSWLSLPSTRAIDFSTINPKYPQGEYDFTYAFTRSGFLKKYGDHPEIFTMTPFWITTERRFQEPVGIIPRQYSAPIGEYGLEWATRLLNADMKLAEVLYFPESDACVRKEALATNTAIPQLINDYTGLGKIRQDDLGTGPIETSVGGINSVLDAAGYLTMYKIPGYENDPDKLLKDLADQGIFSQFSLIITPVTSAQLASHAGVFTNPIIMKDDQRKLSLNLNIIHHFAKQRKSGEATKSTGRKQLDKPGCVVGRKLPGYQESGVDIAAKLFADTVAVQGK